jgi:hypothetical protein
MLAHAHSQSGTMSRAMPQGQPQRLQRIEGEWRLEMEQLVYGGPTMLRPRRFEIRGQQAILQHLREQGDQDALAMEAERLFSDDMSGTHTYIVRGSAWSPLTPEIDLSTAVTPAASAKSGVEIAPVLEQLKRCEKRIAALELTVKELRLRLQVLSETGVGAPAESGYERADERAGEREREREPRGGAEPEFGAGRPAIASYPAVAIPGASGDKPAVGLPAASVLGDLVRSLAGPEASLMPLEDPTWDERNGPAFCSILSSDGGDEVAAVVLEFESAIRLAAALLMESAETVEIALQEQSMTDDLLDAASEVCNTIAASFNKVPGNPHLRAAKLTKLQDGSADWLSSPRGQVGYRHGQGGRVILLAR